MRAKKNLEAANNELEVNLDNALKVTTSLNHFLVHFFFSPYSVCFCLFNPENLFYTLKALSSTYKFSRLASIHFLKKWLRELVKRSKHISFSDHFKISHNLPN